VSQKIVLHSEGLRSRAIEIIKALPMLPVFEVVIREYKKDRSMEQHRYYWQILTIIAAELGETKEELHEQMKEKFLVNIYTRDNEEYGQMIESLRKVYASGMKQEALSLRKQVIVLTSTTTANVAQFSEYLDAIQHHATSLAIQLPMIE